MKQKTVTMTSDDVKIMFETRLNDIYRMASDSRDAFDFKQKLTYYLTSTPNLRQPAVRTIMRMTEADGTTVVEESEGKPMTFTTISLLWQALTDEAVLKNVNPDFLTDVFRQMMMLYEAPTQQPDIAQVKLWMRRWHSGLDSRVRTLRRINKYRLILHLIHRIEMRHSANSRYVFAEGMTMAEKKRQVEQWWDDYHFHLTFAARSLSELNNMLEYTMTEDQIRIYHDAKKKNIPIFVTPYYLSLMDVSRLMFDDSALRSYVLYSRELVDVFGSIKAWEREDKVEPGKPNAAGWLLPQGNNIHRRYPEVAILIPDTIGRACGGLCASCQRMYDFQSGRLNFDLERLKPNETWDGKLRRLMRYFRDDAQIRDILITGGDALMSQNKSIRHILDAIYTMARGKIEDNAHREEGSKYAQLQRVRIGTRLPVYLPMRVDDELIDILADFKHRAEKIGVRQFYIQTHFQTPLEVTEESRRAVRRLQKAGWIVTNQLVFNVTASRRGHTAKLRKVLNALGIVCYYTFSVKGFEENHAVFTPNSRSLQEAHEEKSIGIISSEATAKLVDSLSSGATATKAIEQTKEDNGVPFVATDRNVMNLPGVGKSMTFHLAGIMPDGRRVLAFSHDHTRRHSPVIEHMPVVYIKENKSIAEYMRQLEAIGEKTKEYESIWAYNDGDTELRFPLYDYPSFDFEQTQEVNHISES